MYYSSSKLTRENRKSYEIPHIPVQSPLYISIISSPDLKFCPDLLGDLKSKSYFVPENRKNTGKFLVRKNIIEKNWHNGLTLELHAMKT